MRRAALWFDEVSIHSTLKIVVAKIDFDLT